MGTTNESSGVIMTPEQQRNLKNFGRKNGLSAEKVQAQLEQKPPVQQNTVQPTPTVQLTATKPTEKQPVKLSAPEKTIQDQECETYFLYKDENAGGLEIDLITFREKGVETRYLSVLCVGVDINQNPPCSARVLPDNWVKSAF